MSSVNIGMNETVLGLGESNITYVTNTSHIHIYRDIYIHIHTYIHTQASQVVLVVQNLPANAGDIR